MASDRTVMFEIEGGLVRKVEKSVLGTVPAGDFLEALRQTNGISTGLLPPSCIYFYRQPGKGADGRDFSIMVVERPPKVTSVFYKSERRASSGATQKTIKLSLPFCLFFIRIVGDAIEYIYPCCSKTKVMTLDHPICVLPLPNVYDNGHGHLCVGNITIPTDQPMHVRINTLLMSYFTSEFNLDLRTEYPQCMKRDPANREEAPSIEAWAEKTAENPLFGISDPVTYTPHQQGTFSQMLKHLGWKNE